MEEINRILHPYEVLEEVKEKLLSLYELDYGNKEELRRRWDNTIFVLESTPIDSKAFYDAHQKEIPRRKRIKAKLEYYDFIRKQKEIEKELEEEFHEYTEMVFGIYEKEDRDLLWKSNHPRIPLKKSQDRVTLYRLFKWKEDLIERGKGRLLRRSLWGRRISRKYQELTEDQLSEILLDGDSAASTSVAKNKEGKPITLCYIPLMKLANSPSLDRIFLHEARHVVETTPKKSGLSSFENPVLNTLNEVRTEKNAKKDEKKLPIIFGRKSDSFQSIYELLLEKVEEIEVYEPLMNQLAFEENPDGLVEKVDEDLQAINQRLQKEQHAILSKIKR